MLEIGDCLTGWLSMNHVLLLRCSQLPSCKADSAKLGQLCALCKPVTLIDSYYY